MGWKDRFTYRSKVYVEQDVAGNTLRFYPNRIGVLSDLAEVGRPLARAMSVLFGDDRNDAEAVTEKYQEGGALVEKMTMGAVPPETIRLRLEERRRALDEVVDALQNPALRIQLGRCLMDSLRDEFPYRRERSPADVEEFLLGSDAEGSTYHGLDAPLLAACVKGWARANSKVFGDVGERLAGLVQKKMRALEETRPDPLSDSLSEETPTDDGSSSRMQSSEPWGGVLPSSESKSST